MPTPERSNPIKQPRTARFAEALVKGVDAGSGPVSINTVGGESPNYLDDLEIERDKTEEALRRHRELFFPDNRIKTFDEQDLAAILHETHLVLDIINPVETRFRGVLQGMALLQLSRMALAFVAEPSRLVVPEAVDEERARLIASSHILRGLGDKKGHAIAASAIHMHGIAEERFQAEIAKHIRGDIHKLPFYKFRTAGYLLDLYYQFWKARSAVGGLSDEMQAELSDLWVRFPAKTEALDGHSLSGRPPHEVMQLDFAQRIAEFEATFDLQAPKGFQADSNLVSSGGVIYQAMRAARGEGHTQAESIGLVAANVHTLGQLTRRQTRDFPPTGGYHLQTTDSGLAYAVDHKSLTDDITDKERKRAQEGGACPARYFVAIPADGQTHRGVLAAANAIEAAVGIRPTLLHEAAGVNYVDPAAFILALSLWGEVVNRIAE